MNTAQHEETNAEKDEHDADLEGRGCQLVVVIFSQRQIAFCFGVFRLFLELLAAVACLRIRFITLRGLVPGLDLLFDCGLRGGIGQAGS